MGDYPSTVQQYYCHIYLRAIGNTSPVQSITNFCERNVGRVIHYCLKMLRNKKAIVLQKVGINITKAGILKLYCYEYCLSCSVVQYRCSVSNFFDRSTYNISQEQLFPVSNLGFGIYNHVPLPAGARNQVLPTHCISVQRLTSKCLTEMLSIKHVPNRITYGRSRSSSTIGAAIVFFCKLL